MANLYESMNKYFENKYGIEDTSVKSVASTKKSLNEGIKSRKALKEAVSKTLPVAQALIDGGIKMDGNISSKEDARAFADKVIKVLKAAKEKATDKDKAQFDKAITIIDSRKNSPTALLSTIGTYYTQIKTNAGAKEKKDECVKPVEEACKAKKVPMKKKKIAEAIRSRKALKESFRNNPYYLSIKKLLNGEEKAADIVWEWMNSEGELDDLADTGVTVEEFEDGLEWYIKDIADAADEEESEIVLKAFGDFDESLTEKKLPRFKVNSRKVESINSPRKRPNSNNPYYIEINKILNGDKEASSIVWTWFKEDGGFNGEPIEEFKKHLNSYIHSFIATEEDEDTAAVVTAALGEDPKRPDFARAFSESINSPRKSRMKFGEAKKIVSRKALKESKQKLTESSVEIYLDDLKDDKKAEILEILGGDVQNYDVFPLTTFEVDDEVMNEDLGKDLDKYQKWVDYDMKRYHKISDMTNKELKKAGLTVVKDKYGDYEVITESKKKSNLKECDCEDCTCDGACTCTDEHSCCGKGKRSHKINEVKGKKTLNRTPEGFFSVEYTYSGDDASDYLGHLTVEADTEEEAIGNAQDYIAEIKPEINAHNFKISSDYYSNADIVKREVTEDKDLWDVIYGKITEDGTQYIAAETGKPRINKGAGYDHISQVAVDRDGNIVVKGKTVEELDAAKKIAERYKNSKDIKVKGKVDYEIIEDKYDKKFPYHLIIKIELDESLKEGFSSEEEFIAHIKEEAREVEERARRLEGTYAWRPEDPESKVIIKYAFKGMDYDPKKGVKALIDAVKWVKGTQKILNKQHMKFSLEDLKDVENRWQLVKSDEVLEESKLTERAWKYVVSGGVSRKFRDAVRSDEPNYAEILQAMKDVYTEIHDKRPDLLDDDDYEEYIEDLDFIDPEYDSEEDLEENINYELGNLYDFCDAVDVFIGI